jgi:hypothetical protein
MIPTLGALRGVRGEEDTILYQLYCCYNGDRQLYYLKRMKTLKTLINTTNPKF